MILEKLVILVSIAISYFLQSSVDFFRLGHIKPDLLLILTIYFALYRGSFAGIWVGFLGGLLQDINLGGYFGPTNQEQYNVGTHALPKSLVGYFVGKISGHVQKEGGIVLFFIHFTFGLGKGFLEFLEVALFHSAQGGQVIVSVLFPEALYTAVFSLVWFKVLAWVMPQDKWQKA